MQHAPNITDLPSSAKLIKSTIVAAVVAAFLLVVAILPAEYGLRVDHHNGRVDSMY